MEHSDLLHKTRSSVEDGGKSGFFSNFKLLLIAMFVSLALGEALARIVFGSAVIFPRYHAVADYGDYTLRRTRPNTDFWHTSPDGTWEFRINAQGFRDDDDYSYAKPENTLRVMSLGDSNAQGYEVEQEASFSEVIERYLKQRDIHAEVLNTGISGFGTAEQVAFFESEGVRYRPDIVVLGFFANDYEDSVKSGLFAIENDQLTVKSKTHAPATGILAVVNEIAPLRWLSEHSYLYSVTMNALWVTAKTLAAYAADEAVKLEYAIPSEDITDYKGELITSLIGRLKASVEASGAKLIVVDIPVRSNWKNATRNNRNDGNLESSIPESLQQDFVDNSNRFFSAEQLFGDYRGILTLHRQQGHYHITETAHAVIGIEVAKSILDDLSPAAADLYRLD